MITKVMEDGSKFAPFGHFNYFPREIRRYLTGFFLP